MAAGQGDRAPVERGETDAALRLAEEAYQLVAETDAPLLRGGTLVDLATVRAAAGRLDDAAAAGRQALELFDAKGDEVDAGTTRQLLERLAVGVGGPRSQL